MAFKATRHQQFYLIAKHSGKAITLPNGNNGTTLVQKTFDASNGDQKFFFHKGRNFFWIPSVKHNDRYLTVHASSHNDGIPVIGWQWSGGGTRHNTFVPIPEEDGYYRLMAIHSGKFLDVNGNNSADDAILMQHVMNGGSNQVFKMVPVPNSPVGRSNQTLAETNELVRTITMGAIGVIPKVGGGLAFVIGLFWKEKNKLADLWDQMKTYVDARIKRLIKEDKLKSFGNKIIGQLDVINEIYNAPATDKTRGSRLMGAIDALVVAQRDLWPDDNTPGEDVLDYLPYLVNFGTILISLRATVYREYKTYMGEEPDADINRNNKEKLKETIALYIKIVEKAKATLIDWRVNKISSGRQQYMAALEDAAPAGVELLQGLPDTIGPDNYTPQIFHYSARAIDDYGVGDGWDVIWEQSWSFTEEYYMTGVKRRGYPDYAERAAFAAEQRKSQVRAQFTAEIDELISPYRMWKYFDPEELRGSDVTISRAVGAFGGRHGEKQFAGMTGQRITKVNFFEDGNDVVGLEVHYNGVADGLVGRRTGVQRTLELGTGEYINSVSGYAKDNLNALWFSTNKGKYVGAGNMHNRDERELFYADLQDSFNPMVVRISGAHNSNCIQQLTFHWEYVQKVLTPAKVHAEVATAEVEQIAWYTLSK